MTTSRSRARETATANDRSSSSSTAARAWTNRSGPLSPRATRPASTSTRCWAPSRWSRRRRSGQTPSWTPATTTRSHSLPAAPAAVSSSTAGPASPRNASESAGSSWDCRWSRNAETGACGNRSTNCSAAVNRASTASRSRSALAPPGPPASAACCHPAARSAVDQSAHSTSRAVDPGAARPARAAASPRARRCTPRRTVTGSEAVRAGSATASTRSSSLDRSPPPASSSARKARRSRRRPTASVPPSGETSS